MGFEGQPTIARVWIGRWNKADPLGGPAGASSGPGWRAPSVHVLARMPTSDHDRLSEGDERLRARLLAREPDLAVAAGAAGRLARLLRRKSSEPLADVMAAMRHTVLSRLATNLARDAPAIQAALDTRWTTGPVEGQVNRLKLTKRAMHGRAGFELLRCRVLHGA